MTVTLEIRRRSQWSNELIGGALATIASVPQTIPVGIVVFLPFGAAGVAFGVTSALVAALVGGLFLAVFGPMKVQIAGPRAGSALVLAELVRWMVADDPALATGDGAALARALPMILAAVFLAGLFQLVAARSRIARYVKLLPLSVLSGFTFALGLAMAATTLPAFLGLAPGETLADARFDLAHAGAALACLTPVLTYNVLLWRPVGVPPIALAFLAGLSVALAFGLVTLGSFSLAPLSHLAGALDPLAGLDRVLRPGFLLRFLIFVVILAVVSSVESLLAIVACDRKLDTDTDTNRALGAEGIANMLVALAGGITVSSSLGRTSVNIAAGARGRLSAFVAAGLSGLLLVVGDPQGLLPVPVLQGILFVIGLGMYDGRLGLLVERLRRGNGGPIPLGELAVLGLTLVGTLFFGLITGLALGLGASVLIFLRTMSRPVIRQRLTGRQRRSRRARVPEQAEYLFAHGAGTVVAELEGPIFFGTADQLRRWLIAEGEGPARSILLDLGRTFEIDPTGAAVLHQAIRRVQETGAVAVAIVGLAAGDPRRTVLAAEGLEALAPIFDDLDAGLEWAEERCLAEAPGAVRAASQRPVPFMAGATPDQVAALERHLEHRRLVAGDTVFRQGEKGDALYYLEEGAIRIELAHGGRVVRLATLSPGVFFGEMSLIDGAPRSASAVAAVDSIVVRLSREAHETFLREDPVFAAQLTGVLAADLARRLRLANAELAETR